MLAGPAYNAGDEQLFAEQMHGFNRAGMSALTIIA